MGDETKVTHVKPIHLMVIEFETDEEYDNFIKYATSTEPDNSVVMDKMREMMKNHVRSERRVSKTQIDETPTLEGRDAERLLDSLKIKPTARSRENAKKLAKDFKKQLIFKQAVKELKDDTGIDFRKLIIGDEE